MSPPDVGTRWVHKGCKRIAIVVGLTSTAVEFRYKRSPGTGDLMRVRKTTTQTMPLEEWSRLFTARAT